MASTIVEHFQVDREKIDVVWNHLPVDRYENAYHERASVRESLGLMDDLVVGYCGSIYDRQRVDQGLRLFKMIRRIVSSAHLLAVTQQESRMRALAQNAGIPADAITTCRVPYADTPGYLAAFDLGLITTGLFETPTVLANRVCCPVKFGEYLASGTPVIMSEGIGDYSELTRRENVGLVIDPKTDKQELVRQLSQFLESYQSDPMNWRQRCLDVARRHLDSEVFLPRIAALYDRLTEDNQ